LPLSHWILARRGDVVHRDCDRTARRTLEASDPGGAMTKHGHGGAIGPSGK
jgi:hypothetical protein